MKTNIYTKNLFNPISTTVLVILLGIFSALLYMGIIGYITYPVVVILSILITSSVQIADQWEKAVLLRMGKYIGLKGPGIFFIIPIIDRVINYIDQRVRVIDFKADQTLTKDTVPVNVVAVLYWTVWDVEKAALAKQSNTIS